MSAFVLPAALSGSASSVSPCLTRWCVLHKDKQETDKTISRLSCHRSFLGGFFSNEKGVYAAVCQIQHMVLFLLMEHMKVKVLFLIMGGYGIKVDS